MTTHLRPFDRNGNKITVGENVILTQASENLLKGLPPEDQVAIKAQVGKVLKVVDFDNYGFAEIEFEYQNSESEIEFHTIWVEPSALELKMN